MIRENFYKSPIYDSFPESLTNVSKVYQAVLANISAGTGLRLHHRPTVHLLIADDPQLRGLDTAWQIHIEHRA